MRVFVVPKKECTAKRVVVTLYVLGQPVEYDCVQIGDCLFMPDVWAPGGGLEVPAGAVPDNMRVRAAECTCHPAHWDNPCVRHHEDGCSAGRS